MNTNLIEGIGASHNSTSFPLRPGISVPAFFSCENLLSYDEKPACSRNFLPNTAPSLRKILMVTINIQLRRAWQHTN